MEENQQFCSLISKNVKVFRKRKNYTQKQLADAIPITQQYVSKIEKGKAEPSLDILVSLAKVFGIEVKELFVSYSHLP